MTLCLVTGGAGFIGSHLVEALLRHGHRVRVVDNFRTGSLQALGPGADEVELVLGDLADLDLVRRASEGADLVFHCASPSEGEQGTADIPAAFLGESAILNVLIAARESGVRRVVYASSICVYGPSRGERLVEGSLADPVSAYANAKLTGEQDCVAFTHLYGLETVRLRYANVYGPRQNLALPYAEIVPLVIRTMLLGHGPVVPSDGGPGMDLLAIDDAVRAALLAAETPRASGRAYNIGQGRLTTPREVVAALNVLLGSHLEPVCGPPCPPREVHNLVDTSRARAELGFSPRTDLQTGLIRCLGEHIAWRDRLLGESPPGGEAAGRQVNGVNGAG